MKIDPSEKLPENIIYTSLPEGSSHSLLINLAPREEDLELRLRLFSRDKPEICFCFSDAPCMDSRIDLYLIPLSCLFWLRSIPLFSGRAVFVYGPCHGLPGSFLAGCSDYLKEPWDERELISRAQRYRRAVTLAYPWGCLILRNNECLGPGGSAVLSPTEDTILRTLIRNRQKKVEKELLAHLLWGVYREDSRAVDMHIAKLRKKMKSALPSEVRTIILTCRPGGYMLR